MGFQLANAAKNIDGIGRNTAERIGTDVQKVVYTHTVELLLVCKDFIFGPAFVCDCRGENLDSLSDEQIDRYGKMFRYPEHLARVNGTLLGIPYRPQPEQER